MADSLGHERPAKRMKLTPRQSSLHQHAFVPQASSAMPSMAAMAHAADLWTAPAAGTVFVAFNPTSDHAHWAPVPAPAAGPAPAQVAYASSSVSTFVSTFSHPIPTVEPAFALPALSVPPPAELNFIATNHISHSNTALHSSQQPYSSLARPGSLPNRSWDSLSPAQDQCRRKIRSKPSLVSPFKDCLDSFGKFTAPRFPRPTDGKVNGYIKFHWPERKTTSARSSSISVVTECNDEDVFELTPSSAVSVHRSTARAVAHHSSPDSLASRASVVRSPVEGDFTIHWTNHAPLSSQSSPPMPYSSTPSYKLVPASRSSTGGPRMVPPQFGLLAKMDHMDRQFWSFYIMNWCPGRSVLGKTNLWLKDFAKMHESAGVRAAIQSLAGIYIYDYQPMDAIRKRTNQRFAVAEGRLSSLLNDSANLDDDEATELITITSILSMQDIVLTERRLKKPFNPRWLQGFKQGEHFLELTDQGSRFWHKTNVQLSSLRISQSIIVGRAVILAQPMMPLPAPSSFDPEEEAARFGWLLYGTPQDVYEIHGGCGFSKKLLHILSQITYCAARLQQDRESVVVPLTARYLLGELLDMRQWSSESRDWKTAKSEPQTIEWVRAVPEGCIIDSSSAMTDVTAEAWRMTSIIYLQCRAMRLPRNHPEVIANLTDLAKCISIMPTSGNHFTAQAPLFPAFLLGMLATVPEHLDVSRTWFDMVVSTPVRSSVPPLYEALKRIWSWIEAESDLKPIDCEIAEEIGCRCPWWERLVQRVQESEEEVLCLT